MSSMANRGYVPKKPKKLSASSILLSGMKEPHKTTKSAVSILEKGMSQPKTAEWLRRSKAAKKGWKTRKKRILPKKIRKLKKLINNARIVQGKKPNPRIGGKTRGKRLAQLEAINQALEEKLVEQQRELDGARLTAGWVHASEARMLREDFTIALEPCRLRHIDETEKLKQILNEASGGNFGVAAMDLYKRDRRNLRRAAEEMAEYYDIPIREVYTLFYSP